MSGVEGFFNESADFSTRGTEGPWQISDHGELLGFFRQILQEADSTGMTSTLHKS